MSKLPQYTWLIILNVIIILLLGDNIYLRSQLGQKILVNATLSEKIYPVARVLDGDTIDVVVSGGTSRVRLTGINTPEIKHGKKTAECFGKEASLYLSQLLQSQKVLLVRDPLGADRGYFKRYLRYLVVAGQNLNQTLVAQGYARVYERASFSKKLLFEQLQKKAQEQKLGLWGSCGK